MTRREDVCCSDIVVADGPGNHVADKVCISRVHVPTVVLVGVGKQDDEVLLIGKILPAIATIRIGRFRGGTHEAMHHEEKRRGCRSIV